MMQEAGAGSEDVDVLAVLNHCRPGTRMLELGCGYGRVLFETAKRNVFSAGLDISEQLLRYADAACQKLPPSVKKNAALIQGDFLFLPFKESFDLAVCLGATFHLLAGQKQQSQLLQGVRRALKPGGIFLLNILTPKAVQSFQHHPVKVTHPENEGSFIARSRVLDIDYFQQTIQMRLTFEFLSERGTPAGSVVLEWKERMVGRCELEYLLEKHGFRTEQAAARSFDSRCGDFDIVFSAVKV